NHIKVNPKVLGNIVTRFSINSQTTIDFGSVWRNQQNKQGMVEIEVLSRYAAPPLNHDWPSTTKYCCSAVPPVSIDLLDTYLDEAGLNANRLNREALLESDRLQP